MAGSAKQKIWFHGGSRIENWNHVRWDRDRSESDLNAEGPGMYWTTDLDEAMGYAHGADRGVVYEGRMRAGFSLLPARRPTLAMLERFYAEASRDDQEVFLSNWQVEWSHMGPAVRAVLRKYANQTTLFDAFVTLYHDLFHYDADAYVNALRSMAFDGYVVKKGTTGGSRRRDHLVLWYPRAMDISGHV